MKKYKIALFVLTLALTAASCVSSETKEEIKEHIPFQEI